MYSIQLTHGAGQLAVSGGGVAGGSEEAWRGGGSSGQSEDRYVVDIMCRYVDTCFMIRLQTLMKR